MGRLLLAWMFLFAQSGWAAQDSKSTDKPAFPAKTAAHETNDSSHQGIKVHGHWTIEVRNANGVVVTHREFENALVAPTGSLTLSQLLTGADLAGGWEVQLANVGAASSSPCFGIDPSGIIKSATPLPCRIFTASVGAMQASSFFSNLSAAPIAATGGLTLSGTATAGQTGSIDTVRSYVYYCPAPGPCIGGSSTNMSSGAFTSATVSPAISVSTGQTIAVTVNISFS
jgi:hypothetical protein